MLQAQADIDRINAATAESTARTALMIGQREELRSMLVGQSGSAERLREGHATEADARAAAEAEWQRIQRGRRPQLPPSR